MKVVVLDTESASKYYYRKDGSCFDFVSDEQYATNLTHEQAEHILEHSEWYCKMYGADQMLIEY